MRFTRTAALIAVFTIAPLLAACGETTADDTVATDTVITDTASADTTITTEDVASEAETATTTSSSEATTASSAALPAAPNGGGGPGGVDVESVATVDALVELIQAAYGEANLDLHRGHQPVQDVLDEVLVITHDELHVRMDAGQNLAAVAEELGVGADTLIQALVDSWSPAIDNVLAAGLITEEEAAAYVDALTEAFAFKVNWDGTESTPTFTGV